MAPSDLSNYLDTLTKLQPFLHRDPEEIRKRIDATLHEQLKATRIDRRVLDTLREMLQARSMRPTVPPDDLCTRSGK